MGKKANVFLSVIISGLVIMIFMSKTIYTMNIPVVTAKMPTNGKLKKVETQTGLAYFANIQEIYSDLGCKVSSVLVKEGDKIVKGQTLATFTFDKEEIVLKIKELNLNKNKIALEIETINFRIDKIKNNIISLENQVQKKDNFSNYEIEQLEIKIQNSKEQLDKIKILYESGAIAKIDFDNAIIELKKMEDEYDNLITLKAENENKANIVIKEKELEKTASLKDLEYEIVTSNQDLKSKEIELQNIYIQEEELENKLENFSKNALLKAEKDGIVISIKVKAGQFLNANSLIMSFGTGNEFDIECDVSLENNFILVGDECALKNATNFLKGNVSKITQSEKSKKITVKIQSEKVSNGETFEIKFTKESIKSYNLIPNNAVNKDSKQYYVYTIKKRTGILGDEFYAQKTIIKVEDSDNENTAITSEGVFFDPIVTLSNKIFSDKGTIIVENEGDFYVK